MIRSRTALSPNRSLVVLLLVLVSMLAGITVVRGLVGASLPLPPPAFPLYAPAQNPAPIAPAVDASSAPMPITVSPAPDAHTGASPVPKAQTSAPVFTNPPAQPERLPSLDGNDGTPGGSDGKHPGFVDPPGN